MDVQANVTNSVVKPTVVFGGTSQEGSMGPHIGVLDIGVSDSAYLFRVAMPGIDRAPGKLKCQIQQNGRVQIEGEVASGAPKSSSAYRLIDQELSPAGPFTVSFNLPGPVDARLFTPIVRHDGVMEALVMKSKKPEVIITLE